MTSVDYDWIRVNIVLIILLLTDRNIVLRVMSEVIDSDNTI